MLKTLGRAGLALGASGVAAGLGIRSSGRWVEPQQAMSLPDFTLPADPRWPAAVVARNPDPALAVRAAVDGVGGMARFVKPGETVLLKPNAAWDRTPKQGANTHPEVVAEVIRLCQEARAGRIMVAEVPVHDAERTLVRSGIGAVVAAAGAELLVPPTAGFRRATLGGAVLAEWEVLDAVFEAHRIINLPVVKDHGLSRLTCGLKNWYGLLGGTRGRLHQRIHEAIADLGAVFRPSLTVVDAVRVMMRGGPTGGRPDDVEVLNSVAAGTDPVALDAWGATLLGADPQSIGYIPLAEGRGLGIADPALVEEVRAAG